MENSSTPGPRKPTTSDANGFTECFSFDTQLDGYRYKNKPIVNRGARKGRIKNVHGRDYSKSSKDKAPGVFIWRALRCRNKDVPYRYKPGFVEMRIPGVRPGFTKATVRASRVAARLIAKEDFEKLMANGLLSDPNDPKLTPDQLLDVANANSAVLGLLEIARDTSVPVTERVKAFIGVGNVMKSKPTPYKTAAPPIVVPQITSVPQGLEWLDAIPSVPVEARVIEDDDE